MGERERGREIVATDHTSIRVGMLLKLGFMKFQRGFLFRHGSRSVAPLEKQPALFSNAAHFSLRPLK